MEKETHLKGQAGDVVVKAVIQSGEHPRLALYRGTGEVHLDSFEQACDLISILELMIEEATRLGAMSEDPFL